MCLFTKQIMPIKARNYITCYKVVRRYPHRTGLNKYKTPYMRTSIQLYKEYNVNGPIKATKTVTPMFSVEGGYIHCCTTLDSAKHWLKRNYHLFKHEKKVFSQYAIIKCIIPPGSLYYKNYNGTEIATKKLLTREIVLQG